MVNCNFNVKKHINVRIYKADANERYLIQEVDLKRRLKAFKYSKTKLMIEGALSWRSHDVP